MLDLSDNQLDFNLQQLYFYLVQPLKQCHGLKSLDLSNNPSAKPRRFVTRSLA